MIHNQLKVCYPTGPFLWEYDNMKNTFNAHVDIIDRDTLFYELIDNISIQNEKSINNNVRNHNVDRENIYFLFELTSAMTVNLNKKTLFIRSKQRIQTSKKNLWINFHTLVYKIDNDVFFDEYFETDIAWCIVPIVGDIVAIDDANYVIEPKKCSDNTDDKKDIFDPKTYINNNLCTKKECYTQVARIANRKFIKRDIPIKQNKVDKYLDDYKSLPICELNPRGEQVIMTDKVRKNSYLIRENLFYRSNRLKISERPELLKKHNSVEMCLKDISDKIALHNNTKYKSDEIMNKPDRFDYKIEKIIIKKTCGIWKFCPMNTGRIKIISNDVTISFLTLLKYRDNFVVTHHIIDRY